MQYWGAKIVIFCQLRLFFLKWSYKIDRIYQNLSTVFGNYGVTVEPNGTTHWLVSMGNGSHLDGTINISGLAQNEQQFYILKYDNNGNS